MQETSCKTYICISNYVKFTYTDMNSIYNRLLINILQTISQKYGCGP